MNNTATLYFLRSSENKIISNMISYAYRLDDVGKTKEELTHLMMYEKYFGFTAKDLGLYALVQNTLAGAIWARILKEEENSTAFVDEKTAILSMTVIPSLRGQGVGKQMMEQFLQEAGAVYEQLSVNVLHDSKAINFYEKFGFIILKDSQQKSAIDGSQILTMVKKLEKKEVVRPNDGYNASYWMD